jgi:putative phosphoribosyl transferase
MENVHNHPLSALDERVTVPVGPAHLEGELRIPPAASGVVLFAHGSGSSRHSPRHQSVARVIRAAGIGTFLFDLLTRAEETKDDRTRALPFDIEFLAERLLAVTDWFQARFARRKVNLGYFGASTGGGAALRAAARLGPDIRAVVSRGGRPDLARDALPRVQSPTLLIVGGADYQVLDLNQAALAQLRCEKDLKVIPNATHLFEEPGALDQVAALAAAWFGSHFLSDLSRG